MTEGTKRGRPSDRSTVEEAFPGVKSVCSASATGEVSTTGETVTDGTLGAFVADSVPAVVNDFRLIKRAPPEGDTVGTFSERSIAGRLDSVAVGGSVSSVLVESKSVDRVVPEMKGPNLGRSEISGKTPTMGEL